MPEQKLNLLQFSARSLAQASTAATKVMRRNVRKSRLFGRVLHNVPDRLYRKPFSPDSVQPVDFPEDLAVLDAGGHNPVFQSLSNPIGNWHRPNMTAFANHVDNRPVAFPLFKITQPQGCYFASS